jgi:hypothetical protein
MNKNSDRRSGIDRRTQTGINRRTLVGNGTRTTIRRQTDHGLIFLVDHYSPMLFLTIVGILFLSVIDALLTLFLIDHGASEANPLMAYLLNIGPYAFFLPKYAMTIFAIFGLFMLRAVVVPRFNISPHALLYLLAWVYLAVVSWELYLLYHLT